VPRFVISKEFGFSASHVLHGLPKDHQCARLHGHNYTVEIELAAEQLDARGFVVDYGELGTFREWIDRKLDHRHLNDCMAPNPTAENLAELLYGVAYTLLGNAVAAIRVRETPKTCAEYRP
jgi:6-pyruvoyltetrahydropterin/6-carboxytetrahydropterin synthase